MRVNIQMLVGMYLCTYHVYKLSISFFSERLYQYQLRQHFLFKPQHPILLNYTKASNVHTILYFCSLLLILQSYSVELAIILLY